MTYQICFFLCEYLNRTHLFWWFVERRSIRNKTTTALNKMWISAEETKRHVFFWFAKQSKKLHKFIYLYIMKSKCMQRTRKKWRNCGFVSEFFDWNETETIRSPLAHWTVWRKNDKKKYYNNYRLTQQRNKWLHEWMKNAHAKEKEKSQHTKCTCNHNQFADKNEIPHEHHAAKCITVCTFLLLLSLSSRAKSMLLTISQSSVSDWCCGCCCCYKCIDSILQLIC